MSRDLWKSYFFTIFCSSFLHPALVLDLWKAMLLSFWPRGILCLLWHGFSLVVFSGYSEGHEQSHNRRDTILIQVPIRLSAPRLCFLFSCCLLLFPFLCLFPDTLKTGAKIPLRCWEGGKREGESVRGHRAFLLISYIKFIKHKSQDLTFTSVASVPLFVHLSAETICIISQDSGNATFT